MKSTDKFVLVLVASLALLLAGCGGGSSSNEPEDPGPTPEELAMQRAEMQMEAIETASGAVDTALDALDGSMPTQSQIDAVNSAITRLNSALSAAADVGDDVKSGYAAQVSTATTAVMNAESALMAMENEAAMQADAERVATAMKLHMGISAPMGDPASPGNTDRAADYNGDNIRVSIGNGTDNPTPVDLMEDKDATVATHHGWEGMMFTASPDDDGTYEAVVYSNVGEPTEGMKFNAQYTDLDATTGERPIDTSTEALQMLVASSSFDQAAGKKEFEKGANLQRVVISGSYHGVPGVYNCTPTDADTNCSASVAAGGFTLGGGTWTFKPTDPEARLMDVPDANYASYGWWIHKSENGEMFTASAFAENKGTVNAASGIADLHGTATYTGGAVGKYALHSSTGGMNDAGHFTARAMLEADFSDNTVTGTIDNFMGADGESRNWSVDLMASTVSTTGAIAGDPETNGNTDSQMTTWTMDETAGAAAGQWSGDLYENGGDGVPTFGTGTFYSEFGRDGKMVGAFGVDKDD